MLLFATKISATEPHSSLFRNHQTVKTHPFIVGDTIIGTWHVPAGIGPQTPFLLAAHSNRNQHIVILSSPKYEHRSSSHTTLIGKRPHHLIENTTTTTKKRFVSLTQTRDQRRTRRKTEYVESSYLICISRCDRIVPHNYNNSLYAVGIRCVEGSFFRVVLAKLLKWDRCLSIDVIKPPSY